MSKFGKLVLSTATLLALGLLLLGDGAQAVGGKDKKTPTPLPAKDPKRDNDQKKLDPAPTPAAITSGTVQSVNVPMKTLYLKGDTGVFRIADNCLVKRNGVQGPFGNFSVAAGDEVLVTHQPLGQRWVTYITVKPGATKKDPPQK